MDIICGANGSSTVYVLLNTGSRTFNHVVTIPVSGGTKIPVLTVADFNGDGSKDIAAIAERSSACGGGFVSILLNNGSGICNEKVRYGYGIGGYVERVTSGDVNGDVKPDIIATYITSQGGSQVYLGNGDGTFASGASYNTASQNIPHPASPTVTGTAGWTLAWTTTSITTWVYSSGTVMGRSRQ